MDANTADDFRHSKDPTDRVLWHMRSDTGPTWGDGITSGTTYIIGFHAWGIIHKVLKWYIDGASKKELPKK